MTCAGERPSGAGHDSKPKPAREERTQRKCLRCRSEFRAETRFLFLCRLCRQIRGGVDAG
jgi:Zn finger protein HypA/HybF involved in hydrogenase expression